MATRVADVVAEGLRFPHDPEWDADLEPPAAWLFRLADGTRLSHRLMAIFAAVAYGPDWLLHFIPPRRWHPGLALPPGYDLTVCSPGPAYVVTLTRGGVHNDLVAPQMAFHQMWQALETPAPAEEDIAVWWTINRELVVAWTADAAQLVLPFPLPASSHRPILSTPSMPREEALAQWPTLRYRLPCLGALPVAVVCTAILHWRRRFLDPSRRDLPTALAALGWQSYVGPLTASITLVAIRGEVGTVPLSPFMTFSQAHRHITDTTTSYPASVAGLAGLRYPLGRILARGALWPRPRGRG